jgi:4-hydroxybenzoate polyprenyltransferase
VVTVVALALGIAVGVDAARLAVLTVSVLLGQLSIGLSNDALDAGRDAQTGRTDKPLARPEAPVRTAMGAAVASAALAIALAFVCGPGLALAHAAFLVCAWAYNLGLKATVWSAACFLVGFGVFPSLAPLALADPRVAPAWAWVVGGALGVAVHFSNVLPDLDDDLRTGVRGLPHRLGRRASAAVAFGALIVGAVTAVWAPAAATGSAPATAAWLTGGAVTAIAVAGLVVSLRGAPTRLSFRLVMLAALLLALQLVITGWSVG